MKNENQIAERLNQLVKSKGYSTKEFAELCDTTAPNMSGYLNGKRPIGIKILDKIKEVIPELDLNWLLYNESAEDLNALQEATSTYQIQNHSVDDAIKKLIDLETKDISHRINHLEEDIASLKSILKVDDMDSEMITKLKDIIKKDTH